MQQVDLGDRFEIEGQLGAGGFGTTYVALDGETGQRVAVKVLDLRRVDDWKSVELFEREAKVLRSLDHPGIPAYVDFRPLEADRAAYLVQALAPGKTLERLLETRRFTEAELVDLTRRVLGILDYLTTLHPVVVHRDLKPANILLDEGGTVSLVDFGAVQDAANATMEGGSTVAGTFGYMAPEQLQGIATPSSDLYGLGMTLVHLATGCSPSDLDKKRLKPDFRPKVHFSDGFERVIDRMIEPVPDDRFETASEVLAALDELRDGGEGEDDASWIASLFGQARDEDALSPQSIAAKREAAERKALERAEPEPRRESKAVATPGPEAPDHRVSFNDEGEVAELAIRPTRYWRGREAHFGALAVLGPSVAVGVVPLLGNVAGVVTFVAAVLLAAWLWLFAPTWRLRVTKDGDFIFYGRSPESPKWVGRASVLTIETTPTAKGDRLAWLYFGQPDGSRRGRHFHPLTHTDELEFKAMKRWIERKAKR